MLSRAGILLTIAMGLVPVAHPQTFLTLDFPGAVHTTPEKLNDNGQVVGYYEDGSGQFHGFLYTGGVFTPLNVPFSGGYFTVATGITNGGQIVGAYHTSFYDISGFTYNGGVFSSLNQFPGAIATGAAGVNNSGQIVGSYQNAATVCCLQFGFLYKGGVFSSPGNPPFYDWSANGINDSGQIVGFYISNNDPSFIQHGFLYNGGAYSPIDFPGARATLATGINNSGQIVGYYSDASGLLHGFLDNGGVLSSINFPGAPQTVAEGINNSGQISGWYIDPSSGHERGFVYTPPSCVSLFPAAESFGPSGGLGSFSVDAAPNCSWTVTSSAPWITPISPLPQPGGGPPKSKGNGIVAYAVASNTGGGRTGSVSVGGQTHTVTQQGLSCTDTIAPTFASPGPGGGITNVSVAAPTGCSWKAVSNAAWITVKSGASGSGGGTVVLSVAPEAGGSRSGTVTIAGQTFTVTEGAGDCGAVDLTSKITAVQGPINFNLDMPLQYEGNISVINVSSAVVQSPILLVLLGLPNHLPFPNGITPLANEAGTSIFTTHCFSSQGDAVLNVPVGSMAPGASVNVTFLLDVQKVGIFPGYTIKVLNGFLQQ